MPEADRPAARKTTTKKAAAAPAEEAAGKITPRQMRELHGVLRVHGITGDRAVHDYLTAAGHPVESRADLDTVAAAQLIAELEAAPVRHPSIEAALVAFQTEAPVVPKNQTATVPTKNGGSYTYSYADLADVTAAALPLLTRHGLAFSCCPRVTDRGYELVGRLVHVSGGQLEGALPLYGNSPQDIGSSLTYARRYLLGCITGIVTDVDDDAQAAQPAQRAREWDGPSTLDYLRQIEADATRAGTTLEVATEKFRHTVGCTVEGLSAVPPWQIQPLANAVKKRADEVQAAAAQQPAQQPAAYFGPTTSELLEQIASHADRAGTTLEEITAKWREANGGIPVENLGTLPPQALAPLEASIAEYLAANPPATPVG
jgi:hypothetical protein